MLLKYLSLIFVAMAVATTSISVSVALQNTEQEAKDTVSKDVVSETFPNSNLDAFADSPAVTEQEAREVSISPDAAKTSDALSTAPVVPESASGFVIPYEGDVSFTGGEWVFDNTNKAMQRAISAIGDAVSVCTDGECFNKCDHLAGDIWGYEYASGYLSAATHWATAKKQGIAKFDDREPPLGALLFWDTGRVFGHVATYIGNGQVVTNSSSGEFGPDVYVVSADMYEELYGWDYLGWADPVFFNEEPGSAL
jgi:cell wall-associated NlpC family hydrolase